MKKHVKAALLKAAMSVQDAMKALGLSSVGDEAAVKKAYRDASLKSHPDRGGTKEAMQNVNEAYEVLKKVAKSGGTGPGFTRPSAEEAKAKAKKAMEVITTTVDSAFRPVAFTKHFDNATGMSFTETHKVKVDHDFYFSLDAEWRSGDTVFSLRATANADRVEFIKALGAGGDRLNFKLYVETSILHDNRRVKFKPREWDFTDDQKVLLDPEALFPTAKIKKMLTGANTKRKFVKRDMLLGLQKLLGAYTGDMPFVKIPLHDGFSLIIFRSVILKTAAWDVHSVVQQVPVAPGQRGLKPITFRPQGMGAYAMESEELLKALVEFKKQASGVSDGQKLAQMARDAFKSTHPEKEEGTVAAASAEGVRDNDISMELMGPLYAFLLERVNEVLTASVRDMPEKLDYDQMGEVARRQIALRVALRVLDARVAHVMEKTLGGSVEDASFNNVVDSYIEELGVRKDLEQQSKPQEKGPVMLAKIVAADGMGNSDLTIRDIYDSRPGFARFDDEPKEPQMSPVADFYTKVMNESADISTRLNDLADEAAKALHVKGVDNNEKARLRALRGQIERADSSVLDIGIGII